MRQLGCLGFLLIYVFLFLGCADSEIKYTPIVNFPFTPTEKATIVNGTLGNSVQIYQKAFLPDKTKEEQLALVAEANQILTSQLGSNAYLMIGEINASGYSYTSLDDLKNRICERAAQQGGHVVLVYDSGVDTQQYTRTSPGYSTTNTYGTVSAGSFSANTQTVRIPGNTYSGTLSYPYISGVVFRYVSDDFWEKGRTSHPGP